MWQNCCEYRWFTGHAEMGSRLSPCAPWNRFICFILNTGGIWKSLCRVFPGRGKPLDCGDVVRACPPRRHRARRCFRQRLGGPRPPGPVIGGAWRHTNLGRPKNNFLRRTYAPRIYMKIYIWKYTKRVVQTAKFCENVRNPITTATCLAEMSSKNVSRIKYVDKCPQPLWCFKNALAQNSADLQQKHHTIRMRRKCCDHRVQNTPQEIEAGHGIP